MLETFSLEKYNEALSRGLCIGRGSPDREMCIEAAVCYAFGLPHDDDPRCVSEAVRQFKIRLNDCKWSSPEARAEGLRELGLAQLGSKGVISDNVFASRLALATVNKLLPLLLQEVFPDNQEMLEVAQQCKQAVDFETAEAAISAANFATADHNAACALVNNVCEIISAAFFDWRQNDHRMYSIVDWSRVAKIAAATAAASDYAARLCTNKSDKYLNMSAKLALDILKELGSPGCKFLTR